MKINPKSGHRILIPFAENQVELYPIDELMKIDIDSLKSQQKPTVIFEMRNQKFNDAIEFRKFLGFE